MPVLPRVALQKDVNCSSDQRCDNSCRVRIKPGYFFHGLYTRFFELKRKKKYMNFADTSPIHWINKV
jgi:hypothetical protein